MEKIFGKKLHMTQMWKGDAVVPVTIVRLDIDAARAPAVWEVLKENAHVAVSGLSRGKGFQGVVKRHGFHGGPKTHGQKDKLRAPGSIGPTAPQRTIKGRKMPGHMGNRRVTIKRVTVVEARPSEQSVALRGPVPGARNGKVEIRFGE